MSRPSFVIEWFRETVEGGRGFKCSHSPRSLFESTDHAPESRKHQAKGFDILLFEKQMYRNQERASDT